MSDHINRLTAQMRAGTLTPAQWATALHAHRHGHDHGQSHDHGDQTVPSRDYQMMVACDVCAEGVVKGDEENCGTCGCFVCHDHWQVVDSEPMCDSCREDRRLYFCEDCDTWVREGIMTGCERCSVVQCEKCAEHHTCE